MSSISVVNDPRARTWSEIAIGIGVPAAAFLVLYWSVLRDLVRDWAMDGNYSHGFLIFPLAAYFAWERRSRLARIPIRPRVSGIVVVCAGIGLLLAGRLGAELFVTRFSMIPVIAGGVVFVLGWNVLAALGFPLAFLLLMIPIPAVLFNQITFPLQLLASRLGVAVLAALSIPVLREGNVIVLANTSLQVVEACSGIRSLVSLLTLGIIFGYFTEPRVWARLILAAATVPIAIVTNGLRVAATGIAAHYYGAATAEGVFHTYSGWIAFVPALVLLVALGRVLKAVPAARLQPVVPAQTER